MRKLLVGTPYYLDLETARREYRAETMGDADLALAEGRIHVGEPPDIDTRTYVVKNGRYHRVEVCPPARPPVSPEEQMLGDIARITSRHNSDFETTLQGVEVMAAELEGIASVLAGGPVPEAPEGLCWHILPRVAKLKAKYDARRKHLNCPQKVPLTHLMQADPYGTVVGEAGAFPLYQAVCGQKEPPKQAAPGEAPTCEGCLKRWEAGTHGRLLTTPYQRYSKRIHVKRSRETP